MSFWAEVNQSIGAKLYSTTSFLRQPVNQLPAAMSPADITLITRGKIPLNLEKFRPLVPAEIMTLAGSLPNWKQKSPGRPSSTLSYNEGSEDDCDESLAAIVAMVGRLANQHCLRESDVCQTLRRFLAI